MAGKNPRASRKYRQQAARLKRSNRMCWLCGKHIDITLPYTHAQSWTADHVDPIGAGGDLHGELRPAHRSCNSARGDGRRNKPRFNPNHNPTSRDW